MLGRSAGSTISAPADLIAAIAASIDAISSALSPANGRALPGKLARGVEAGARHADARALERIRLQKRRVVVIRRRLAFAGAWIVRIGLAFEHAQHRCGACDRRGHRTRGVLIQRERNDAVAADASGRWPDADQHAWRWTALRSIRRCSCRRLRPTSRRRHRRRNSTRWSRGPACRCRWRADRTGCNSGRPRRCSHPAGSCRRTSPASSLIVDLARMIAPASLRCVTSVASYGAM